MDELPDYMKLLYKSLLDVYKEMEDCMAKEGKAHHVNYAKEAVRSNAFSQYHFINMHFMLNLASGTAG